MFMGQLDKDKNYTIYTKNKSEINNMLDLP